MKILHCIYHSCSRVHKLAFAQAKAGHSPYLINAKFSTGHPWWAYKMVARVFSDESEVILEHIRGVFEEMEGKVDVIHCHNRPDWWVPIVSQCTKKPVFYDVHDLTSLVRPGDEQERESFLRCAGIFTVSNGYAELVRAKTDKPIHVYESRVPRDFWPMWKEPQDYLVHMGVLSRIKQHHRNWYETFINLRFAGVKLHVLASDRKNTEEYALPFVFNPLPYQDMMGILSTATAGLLGSPYPKGIWEHAMPNKFFEYLAAGIPMIALDAGDCGKIIDVQGLGISVDHALDIRDAYKEIKENPTYRVRAREFAKAVTMESQVAGVDEFYKKFL